MGASISTRQRCSGKAAYKRLTQEEPHQPPLLSQCTNTLQGGMRLQASQQSDVVAVVSACRLCPSALV